jgi:hypothetical protein
MNVVISQPMFFPWIGLFEQIKLADVYVHYDDVQYSKGAFTNRVQIWNGNKIAWMSVPVIYSHSNINQIAIDNRQDWRRKHLNLLNQSYANAPFKNDMLDIVQSVYVSPHEDICSLSISSIKHICRYLNLNKVNKFRYSSEMEIPGKSSQRVFDIVRHLEGTKYITGHGAQHYLDHSLFENNAIQVRYMDYQKTPYPQLTQEFTPFVSTLDLIANCGTNGISAICSGTKDWKEFVK